MNLKLGNSHKEDIEWSKGLDDQRQLSHNSIIT